MSRKGSIMIRTGSVHKSPVECRYYDARLKFETRFFRHVTVISKSLAVTLGIAHKAHILPLGADVISPVDKMFDKFHLLYVGTLSNRKIDVTISGIKKFCEEFIGQTLISYTIIGSGPNNEEQALDELVAQYGLAGTVNIVGAIPHTQLKPWFDKANVGVSYVPMTDYYDCQPVTKTLEYLLSGMLVLATNTSENRKVIDPENGMLVGDTAEAFCLGLKEISEKRNRFDSGKMRIEALGYTWEKIVQKNLHPYLEELT